MTYVLQAFAMEIHFATNMEMSIAVAHTADLRLVMDSTHVLLWGKTVQVWLSLNG